MALLNPSMEDLPVPIMVDILSRLPVKTIIHCKCVCKKWLELLSDSYFANLHLLRSPTSLMIHHSFGNRISACYRPGILKWVEVEDELDHHHLHHDPLMSLDLNLAPILQNSQMLPVGSVNGLICLWQFERGKDNTYICNPITREYMILSRQENYRKGNQHAHYSFGVGPVTGEYKVIRISLGKISEDFTSTSRLPLLKAQVYTLGTGRWRSLGHVPYFLNGIYAPFLNGYAHWIVVDHDFPEKLCAFDFDKESFELFPSPPSGDVAEKSIEECLGVIKGCLCRCDTYLSKFTVWVMKEYGIKNSWHKELVIEQGISYDLGLELLEPLYIIQGLKDGTILMASFKDVLFVYCPRRNIIIEPETFDCNFRGFAYRPSFHRLRNYNNERVHVF